MKKRKSHNTSDLSNLAKQLCESFNIDFTHNTNTEVDIHLHRAKHECSEPSMNWLLSQFFSLIISIGTTRKFFKKNPYTHIYQSFEFDQIKEDDVEDLIPELVAEFKMSVEIFDWSTPFNSWIKNRLEYFALNFHTTNGKYYQREQTTLESKLSEMMNCGCDDNEDESFINRTDEKKGAWNNSIDLRESVKERDLHRVLLTYAEQRFNKKKLLIYRLFFVEELSMSEIATKLGYSYHSTVSNVVKEIRCELAEYLSKIDEEYDALYEKHFIKKSEVIIVTSPDQISSGFDKIDKVEEDAIFDIPSFADFKLDEDGYDNIESSSSNVKIVPKTEINSRVIFITGPVVILKKLPLVA